MVFESASPQYGAGFSLFSQRIFLPIAIPVSNNTRDQWVTAEPAIGVA
jgi:hypothetical protein